MNLQDEFEQTGMSNVEVNIGGKFAYRRDHIIGHGSFAIVFKGRTLKEESKRPVAVKHINQKNISKNPKLLQHEIQILKELKHANIVQLFDCYQDKSGIHLVMEWCNGGDLMDYLQKKKTLSEPVIRMFLKQIAAALKLLDEKLIVHRDLKPQNLLLAFDPAVKSPLPEDIRIKVADFGFARHLEIDTMAATLCGSPMYMAPEVMMHLEYDSRADIWSVGTIVYQCLVGKAPFIFPNPQKLKSFYENNPNLKPNIPENASQSLRSLLLMILKRNQDERCTFKEFFAHPFLSSDATSSQIPQRHRINIQGNTDAYQIYSKTAPQERQIAIEDHWPIRNSGSPVLGGFGGGGDAHQLGQNVIFTCGQSPPSGTSPLAAGVQNLRMKESECEESVSVTSSGESADQVITHDEDEYGQNMSSTITSDLDTPEGFVLVPSNIDQFGRVIKSSSPERPQFPHERTPSNPSPQATKQLQTATAGENPSKFYAATLGHTPVKSPSSNNPSALQRPLGSVSPIDRHRIITDSQGVKFIVGSPPHSPAPSPTIGNTTPGQNMAPVFNRANSLSSNKQFFYPQAKQTFDVVSQGYGPAPPVTFENTKEMMLKNSAEKSINQGANVSRERGGKMCTNVDLPRAVTFHQLNTDYGAHHNMYDPFAFTNSANNAAGPLGLSPACGMLAPIRNLNNNPVFGIPRHQDVYNANKIHTEPNLLALVPESNFRGNFQGPSQPFPSGGAFSLKTQPRFWSQGIANTNPDRFNQKAPPRSLTKLNEHERAVSTPNFTLAMTQANFGDRQHSPIHSSPMRKLSSELLHIAYSPSPPHRKHSNSEGGNPTNSRSSLQKSEMGYQPSLNIHEQLCDSNSDLANEVPISVFSVSPSSQRRRSLSSLIRGSFDGSDLDLAAVPRDLSDVNIMTDKERELAENLTMALSIAQCLFKFATANTDILPEILSESASDYLKDRDWDLDFPMEINTTTEKIMFLLRSLEVIRNCADQVKEAQHETHFSPKTNLILRQLHDTFSTNLCSLQKMCSDNPEYSNLSLSTDQLRNCANGVIYAQALQSCREAALDEQSHCWRRAYYNYRNAQLLLSCLLLDAGIENDRSFITRVFQMVEYRLECCLQSKIAEKQESSS